MITGTMIYNKAIQDAIEAIYKKGIEIPGAFLSLTALATLGNALEQLKK